MIAGSSRGVSEVVGFVLVFSLVVSTVGIVYATGFGGIEEVQNSERLSNAERAFDVLADNIEDIYREDAPSRATEIKLSDANLAFGESSTLQVEVSNGTGSNVYSKSIDPIIYTAQGRDTQIVYEAGAVIRTDRSSGTIRSEPPLLFVKDGATRRVVIPIVQTRSVGSAGVGGSTTALVRTQESVKQSLTTRRDPAVEYDVTVTFETTTTRAPIWEAYFDEQLSWVDDPCSTSGGTMTCSFPVDEVYVTWTGIDVQLET